MFIISILLNRKHFATTLPVMNIDVKSDITVRYPTLLYLINLVELTLVSYYLRCAKLQSITIFVCFYLFFCPNQNQLCFSLVRFAFRGILGVAGRRASQAVELEPSTEHVRVMEEVLAMLGVSVQQFKKEPASKG